MLSHEIQAVASHHAEWIRSCGVTGQRANLSGLDLNMSDLSGLDFSDGLFVGTRLERANLSGCILARANFHGALLGYSILIRADLQDANLTSAHAPGVRLDGASLRRALLEKADFESSQLVGADLTNSHGRLVQFNRCNLAGAKLDGAAFEDVQFIGANLTNASMCGTTLWGVSLLGATARGVDFAAAAKVEYVDSGGDLLRRQVAPGDVVLTGLQSRRLNHLHRKRWGVNEIAGKIAISRSVVRANIERIEAETLANRPATAKHRLANIFKVVGTVAFATAGCSLLIVLTSGAVDLFLLAADRANTGFGGYWYSLWIISCFLSVTVGIYSFVRRDSLTQAAFEYLSEQSNEELNAVSTKAEDREPVEKGFVAENKETQ